MVKCSQIRQRVGLTLESGRLDRLCPLIRVHVPVWVCMRPSLSLNTKGFDTKLSQFPRCVAPISFLALPTPLETWLKFAVCYRFPARGDLARFSSGVAAHLRKLFFQFRVFRDQFCQ